MIDQPLSERVRILTKMPLRGGSAAPLGVTCPVSVHRHRAMRTCSSAFRTTTSSIVRRLCLKKVVCANSCALWISARPFHHRPTTLTNSAFGANSDAKSAMSCRFQASANFSMTFVASMISDIRFTVTVRLCRKSHEDSPQLIDFTSDRSRARQAASAGLNQ